MLQIYKVEMLIRQHAYLAIGKRIQLLFEHHFASDLSISPKAILLSQTYA